MTLKLYYSIGACSLSPHIALREAGLDFTLEKIDVIFSANKQTVSGGDIRKDNPKGMVPVLVLEDGEVLTEGPAIVNGSRIRSQVRASRRLPARSRAIT